MTDPVLAIDIGGTKLAAAVVDRSATVGRRARRATPAGDAEEIWTALAGLVAEVLDGAPVAAVGVGCGGPLDPAGGRVSPLNIAGWRDFPLRDRLTDLVGVPTVVHNDAIAFALAEQRRGAGRAADAMLGVVVSTGVGGGIVLDGHGVAGPTGNAGHVGHVVVDPHGPPCACGGRGCLEAVARGPALVRWAQDNGWRTGQGPGVDGVALVTDARDGDPVALAALTRGGQALGTALASTVALLDLDVVVVGGGVANAGELLLGPAREAFARHAGLDYARRCSIVPAALGADAGVVGAAELARDLLARAAD
jgi:glucokinase